MLRLLGPQKRRRSLNRLQRGRNTGTIRLLHKQAIYSPAEETELSRTPLAFMRWWQKKLAISDNCLLLQRQIELVNRPDPSIGVDMMWHGEIILFFC